MIDFEIIPKCSLGPFQFEASIERYTMLYPYSFSKAEHEEDWDTYVFFDEKVNLYTEPGKNKIESISCISDRIFLNGIKLGKENIYKVLIKLSIDINSLSKEVIHLSDTDTQTAYDLDEFGIQLWVNNKNTIEKVFCMSFT